MEIKKSKNGKSIRLAREDIESLLANRFFKTKQEFSIKSDLPHTVIIHFTYARKLSKSEEKKRQRSLEESKGIDVFPFIEEFRKSATPETKRSINQFCNVFRSVHFRKKVMCLYEILSISKEDFLRKFAGIGEKSTVLFENYLEKHGHRFAIWNGVKFI